MHLDDLITITKFEAGIGGSTMADMNGKPLEAGEVVDDLIRGMMYLSGNNATYAVARHVAQGYFGPAADLEAGRHADEPARGAPPNGHLARLHALPRRRPHDRARVE